MTIPWKTDIIVTVWNHPVETRNCLVSLIEHAQDARLVLFDNGSDRETEQILEEFAEGLGDRALLLKSQANLDRVKAINRCVERAEADNVVIVRNTSIVSDGWLEPMLELVTRRPEAGIVVPRLCPHPAAIGKSAPLEPETECPSGSFAAMLLTRRLIESVGVFDETLDGDQWCLLDYSRRALDAGFLTFATFGGGVQYSDSPILGSRQRRDDLVRRSMEEFRRRWGIGSTWCVHFPGDTDLQLVRERLDLLLEMVRTGYRIDVAVHPGHYRELELSGHVARHSQLRIVRLPRFFAARAARKVYESLLDTDRQAVAIAGLDGVPFPEVGEYAAFGTIIDRQSRRAADAGEHTEN